MCKPLLSLSLGIFLLLFTHTYSFAQSVSGTVKESGTDLPLIGATLNIEGTTSGTTTDGSGQIDLQASPGDVVLVSYIGFVTQKLTIQPEQNVYDIYLSPDRFLLSELVVTGALGLERPAREMGGSADIIRSSELTRGKTVNPITGLQGKVSGL